MPKPRLSSPQQQRQLCCPRPGSPRGIAQSGASLVEFLLISIPMLLLTLGGIELAYWFHVRQVVDLALVQAARAGATQHAQPHAIAQAFEDALRPLFLTSSAQASHAHLANTMTQRRLVMDNNPPWQIRILRPNASDFVQFADPTVALNRETGLATIRNDYQYAQAQRFTQGVTHAHPASQAQDNNIFAANTLVLQLVYPHAPLIPGMGKLLASLNTHTQPYARHALRAGLLPMARELQLDMASHPVHWPSLPDGRVIQADAPETSAPMGITPAPCVGLWCQISLAKPLPQPRPAVPEPTDPVGNTGLPPWELGDTDILPGDDGSPDTLPPEDWCP